MSLWPAAGPASPIPTGQIFLQVTRISALLCFRTYRSPCSHRDSDLSYIKYFLLQFCPSTVPIIPAPNLVTFLGVFSSSHSQHLVLLPASLRWLGCPPEAFQLLFVPLLFPDTFSTFLSYPLVLKKNNRVVQLIFSSHSRYFTNISPFLSIPLSLAKSFSFLHWFFKISTIILLHYQISMSIFHSLGI